MPPRLPKNIPPSRLILFFLTALYSVLSTILFLSSTIAAAKSYLRFRRQQYEDTGEDVRAGVFLITGQVGMFVSLVTGITALNTLKSPEKKRLLANAQGVGMEKIGLYIIRAVLFTLVLYLSLILFGWIAGVFADDFTDLYIVQVHTEHKYCRASITSTLLLHIVSSLGVTLVGLAAAFARPTPPESSLRPVSPGTIDPEMPATSRV